MLKKFFKTCKGTWNYTIVLHISSALAMTIWKGQTSCCKTCFWTSTASRLNPGNAPLTFEDWSRVVHSPSGVLCSRPQRLWWHPHIAAVTAHLMWSGFVHTTRSLHRTACRQGGKRVGTAIKDKDWMSTSYVDGWSQLSRQVLAKK